MITGHIPLCTTGQPCWLGGVITAAREAAVVDGVGPGLELDLDIGDELACVLVPPDVWPTARDVLAPGRPVGIYATLDASPHECEPRHIATEVTLQGIRH